MCVYIYTHTCIYMCIFISPKLNSSRAKSIFSAAGPFFRARGTELADKCLQETCALTGDHDQSALIDRLWLCLNHS